MNVADDTSQELSAEEERERRERLLRRRVEDAKPGEAVNALIAAAIELMDEPAQSIRDLEVKTGMTEGALSKPLAPKERGKWPTVRTIEKFAEALDASVKVVSRAFSRDSFYDEFEPIATTRDECMAVLARLPVSFQDTALQQLKALADLASKTGKLAINNKSEPE